MRMLIQSKLAQRVGCRVLAQYERSLMNNPQIISSMDLVISYLADVST